jgi:hypothetical protein
MDVRMKASNNAFLLLALLPCPKFLHPIKDMRGPLENRVIHHCIDIICAPLKITAKRGQMMSDPLGLQRFCHTPLAVYIADTQEAVMLASVAGKTSHLTVANYKQFGDPFRHEPRTGSTTLAQIDVLTKTVDPWDLQAYHKLALKKFRLNPVHLPFWRNWPISDPSHFFCLDVLYHFHKACYDHEVQWCIRHVGEAEINFRYSVIQPRKGFRHFSGGIAGIKQATGREHRDIQRSLIAVIADAADRRFVIAIRALIDFCYLAQRQSLTSSDLAKLTASLKEFHDHKQAILDARARLGSKNNLIDDFRIPKLELLQSLTSTTRLLGVAIQWSTDVTEHCNITLIKDPARAGNNKNYDMQICRYLDREEKTRLFELATSVRQARTVDVSTSVVQDSPNDSDDDDSESTMKRFFIPTIQPPQSGSTPTNYFITAKKLLEDPPTWTPRPLRTFSTMSTAFHLTHRANKTRMTVDDAVIKFNLPDLRPALADYVQRVKTNTHFRHKIGGRRIAAASALLPFTEIQIWYSVRMQVPAVDASQMMPPEMVHAAPPSKEWPSGRYDSVLLVDDPTVSWPGCGITGMFSIYFKLILTQACL